MERIADRTIAETHERFWSNVEKTPDGCWLWTGVIRGGYGRFKIRGRYFTAHRLAYEWEVGPIPAGLTLDHTCHTEDDNCRGGPLCQHRRCVNPEHLEPVTTGENIARGRSPFVRPDLYDLPHRRPRADHSCGLPLAGKNLYVKPSGERCCRSCRRAAKRAARRAERA